MAAAAAMRQMAAADAGGNASSSSDDGRPGTPGNRTPGSPAQRKKELNRVNSQHSVRGADTRESRNFSSDAALFAGEEVKAVKTEPVHWVVPKHYLVPRKVVVRSLEVLDANDSPNRPGMMFETTLQKMVDRFDTVFGIAKTSSSRGDQVTQVLDHLRRHTRRRRGDTVLAEGYLEWEQTSRIYELFCTELNFCERLFFTVDVGESSSVLSKLCSFFLIFMIFVSIVTWMVSTLPSVQEIEANCMSIEVGACSPEPYPIFKLIESVCVITFTVEYFIRLLTVHSVRFALLDEYFMEAVLCGTNMKDVRGRRSESAHSATNKHEQSDDNLGGPEKEEEEPESFKLDGKLKTTLLHLVDISNIIDLLAILPFWLETFDVQGGGGFLVVLRILRLTRIFRVFKLGKYNDVFTLFTRVVQQSMPALLLMLFFICLGCCLFGTLVWFAEQGTWYPEGNPLLSNLSGGNVIVGRGAWLRHTGSKDVLDFEESPFQSIIHSFWYVIVTITTVGYGDIFPRTLEGKLIAAIAILNGIIVLAMPIGVVGANFSTEYYRVVEDKKRRKRMKQQTDCQAVLEEQEDRALRNESDDTGTLGGADSEDASQATEALRVDVARSRILGEAEALDKNWQLMLPAVMHEELSDSLRLFVLAFLGADAQGAEQAGAKPKIQINHLLNLDGLTSNVNRAIATVTSGDELAEVGLKEAFECRKKWLDFVVQCWEYATKMCLIEKRQDPPEYFQMKARLAARIAPRGSTAPGGENMRKSINASGASSPSPRQGMPTIVDGGQYPGDANVLPTSDRDRERERENGSPRQAGLAGSSHSSSPPPAPPQGLGALEAGVPERNAPEVTGPAPPEPQQAYLSGAQPPAISSPLLSTAMFPGLGMPEHGAGRADCG